MTSHEFERHLQQFYRLLKKEKMILIKNQASLLSACVEKKATFIPMFSSYEGEVTEAIRRLVADIQIQQQENLLLTEQAISFQTVLMEAVKDNIKPPANTYSKYQTKPSVTTAIIDQDM